METPKSEDGHLGKRELRQKEIRCKTKANRTLPNVETAYPTSNNNPNGLPMHCHKLALKSPLGYEHKKGPYRFVLADEDMGRELES